MTSDFNIPDLLPHRSPFIFLDRISQFNAEEMSIEGTKTYAFDNYLLTGLQDRNAIVPPSILIESMAQLSAVLSQIANREGDDISDEVRPGYLAAIISFESHEPVRIGQHTVITARITHSFGTMIRSSCTIRVADRLCATAELSFRIEV